MIMVNFHISIKIPSGVGKEKDMRTPRIKQSLYIIGQLTFINIGENISLNTSFRRLACLVFLIRIDVFAVLLKYWLWMKAPFSKGLFLARVQ